MGDFCLQKFIEMETTDRPNCNIRQSKYLTQINKKREEINSRIVERNTGIEPASQAWEARALPMC